MMPSVKHIFSTPVRWAVFLMFLLGVILVAPLSSLAQGDVTLTPTSTTVPTLIRPTVVSTGLPPIGGATSTRTRVPAATRTPSATVTRTSTATRTPTRTQTTTSTYTVTPAPSVTLPASVTFTAFPTSTTIPPTATNTTIAVTQAIVPSVVSSLTPTSSLTSTPTATTSPTTTLTESPTVTLTASLMSTETSTLTPTMTQTATQTATATNTTTRVPAVVESSRPDGGNTVDDGGTSPIIFLAGIILTGLVGGYIVMFATSQAAAERYANGFVIQACPVCYEGQLYMEERSNRVLGILRIRRTVRCDNCRSVLREVGKHRWRYAVDRAVSPEMYASLNNRPLREEQLIDLVPHDEMQSPEYFEDTPDEF